MSILRNLVLAATLTALLAGSGYTYFKNATVAESITANTRTFVLSLTKEQQKTVLHSYDTPKRVDWHFIPKDERKGMQIRHMNEKQRKAAFALLQSVLSEAGYSKATKIMELEGVLNFLEKGKGRWDRNPEMYYFTVFGQPEGGAKWGLSIEGHHLSLNFVMQGDQVLSSSPQFFATNPATVKEQYIKSVKVGTRVLAVEEQAAFDLVNALTAEQQKTAVIAAKAPREIRAAGSPQPPVTEPEGIAAKDLTKEQAMLLKKLVDEYISAMPKEIATARRQDIRKSGGLTNIYFAWAGATKPGIGHYYRVQGPTFLIEFVNTQPDPAGNPANHIHCVWRDPRGDFALSQPAK